VSSRTVWSVCEQGHGGFVKERRQKNAQRLRQVLDVPVIRRLQVKCCGWKLQCGTMTMPRPSQSGRGCWCSWCLGCSWWMAGGTRARLGAMVHGFGAK
jgi:hypothetical protein